MKHTILVTGAGGAGGIGFSRSLRANGSEFRIIGVDHSRYNLQRAEADVKLLIPSPTHPKYIDSLIRIIKEHKVEFLHVQTSGETLAISEARHQLPCRTMLPSHTTIVACADKYATYKRWQDAGIKVPTNMILGDEADLIKAFEVLGPEVWLRFREGSAGSGALPTNSLGMAREWINRFCGWGRFLAAQKLGERTITFESIWKDGQLLVAQQRERLYWEHANRAPSGVTGITGTSVTVDIPEITESALECIQTIDPSPTGLLTVDFAYDQDGVPNPTEINAGRFVATIEFFTRAGVNFPLIFVTSGLGEQPPAVPKRINPLPAGVAWIRGMDINPILMNLSDIIAAAESEQTASQHSSRNHPPC
jgi:carbamoyl-phosphate synthase large subunit